MSESESIINIVKRRHLSVTGVKNLKRQKKMKALDNLDDMVFEVLTGTPNIEAVMLTRAKLLLQKLHPESRAKCSRAETRDE